MDANLPRVKRLNAALFCFVLTWFGTTIGFLVTASFMVAVRANQLQHTVGYSEFIGVLGLGLVCGFFLGLAMIGAACLLYKRHTYRRMLIPVMALIVFFCSAYLIGDILFDSPQEQLFTVIQDVIRRESFAITKGLARQLGWWSILLFPIFIATVLIDLLILPFIPFLSPAVHAQFLKTSVYLAGLTGCSMLPTTLLSWPLLTYFASQEEQEAVP